MKTLTRVSFLTTAFLLVVSLQHVLGGVEYAIGVEIQQSAEVDSSQFVSYKTSDYSIKYPSDWSIDTSGNMGTEFIFLAQTTSDTDIFRENVTMLVQNLEGLNIDLQQYAEVSEAQVATMITDGDITYSMQEEGAQGPYHRIIYSGKQGIYTLMIEQYYFIKDEKAYVLTFTTPEDEYEELKGIGRHILDSFSLH